MPDTENIINVDFQKAEQDKLPGVEKVYQIKITLNDLRPPFWRRLQIPAGITFMELHLILQEALGWENAHLFAFRFRHTEVGMQMDDFMGFGGQESMDAQETVIDELLESEEKCVYEYDFGDGWNHKLVLEKILPAEPGKQYPVCMAGRRCCPPEDIGGVWGYDTFLQTISDPSDPEHDAMLEWATGDPKGVFDPEAFDLKEINGRLGKFARCAVMKSQQETPVSEEPSAEQWERLFSLAKTIKELKPWEKLWDSDLFAIELPERTEPVFVEVLGRNEECYAIVVYPGWKALKQIYDIDDHSPGSAFISSVGKQDCLMCHYGNREEVEPWDREIYNRLGLKFRGRNQWVYFRSILPGYTGWHLSSREAVLMEAALSQFIEAYQAFSSGELSVQFDQGELFWRTYSPKIKTWRNECRSGEIPKSPLEYVTVEENETIRKLRKVKQIKKRIALMAFYLPFPIEEKGQRPYYPHLVLMLDLDSGLICQQKLLTPEDDFILGLLNILDNFIFNFGRPKSLYVSAELYHMMADYCNKCGIKPQMNDLSSVEADLMESLLGTFGFDDECED